MTVVLRAYDADGLLLDELPDLVSSTAQDALNDTGSGSVIYPRDGAGAALLDTDADRELAVLVDGAERFRFLLEDDETDETDPADTVTITGRGELALLDRALVYPVGGAGTTPASHAFLNVTPGELLRVLLERAQARGALLGVSWSFTDAADSAGTPWPQLVSVTYDAGVSLLAVVNGLTAAGIIDVRMAARELAAYVGDSAAGLARDRTDAVTFARARDLLAAPRKRTRRGLASAVLVVGDEGANLERVDAGTEATLGGRRELFVSEGGVSQAAMLSYLGDAQLVSAGTPQQEVTHGLTLDPDGPQPFVDYVVGDYVSSDLTGTLETFRARQLTLAYDSTGATSGELALGDLFQEAEVRNARRIAALTGGSSGDGVSGSPTTSPVTGAESDTLSPAAPADLVLDSTTALHADGTSTATLLVTWSAVTTNVDTSVADDVAGYLVSVQLAGTAERPAGRVTGTATAVGELPPGASVTVRVHAVDRAGNIGPAGTAGPYVLETDTSAPEAPSAPAAVGVLAGVRVTWDGLDHVGAAMPPDLDRVEVHASAASGFAPSAVTLVDALPPGAGAATISSTGYGGPLYVKLVAVDRSGNRSAASAQANATPQRALDTDLANAAVTAAKLAVDSVTPAAIAAGAITAPAIALDAVTAAAIAAGAVTANELAAGAVTTVKLAAGSVTANELAAGSVTTAKLVAGAITAASAILADAAVVTAKIADLAVTDAKIGSLTATKLTAGSILADLTVAARIKTADTGARVELNSAGLKAYDASNTLTVNISSTGAATFTGTVTSSTITGSTITGGTIRTAASGQRVELSSGSVSYLKLYSGDPSEVDFGSVRSYIFPAYPATARRAYTSISSPTLTGNQGAIDIASAPADNGAGDPQINITGQLEVSKAVTFDSSLAVVGALTVGGYNVLTALSGGTKIRSGTATVNFAAAADASVTINFAPAFAAAPVMLATIIGGSGATGGTIRAGQGATGASAPINCHATAVLTTSWTVGWVAIGN